MTRATTPGCDCPASGTVRVIDEHGAGQVCALHAISLVSAAETSPGQLTIVIGGELSES